MNNAIFNFKEPKNEPLKQYTEGSEERNLLLQELKRQSNQIVEIPLIIGGKEVFTGNTANVEIPHNHKHILAKYHKAGDSEVNAAIEAALKAKKQWLELSWVERASIMLKAAELISKKYRYVLNAATMLGQGKNAFQAEIDSACETIDFLRFNAHFVSEIFINQPGIGIDNINRLEYRPLEGFIFTITPFNFTAIASNLNTSVAIMGNTTVWKPATTSLLSSYYLMQIFKEAGLPDGVINFVPGSGALIGDIVLKHPEMAGIHFTEPIHLIICGKQWVIILSCINRIRVLWAKQVVRILFLLIIRQTPMSWQQPLLAELLNIKGKNARQHRELIFLNRCGMKQKN
jgi:1-pyrroline-5-carboxylate dehydrogenase